MYIILEGIDKQGKTSLAKHLSEKFNLPIKKFSKPDRDPYLEYMEFLTTNKEPMILDRFYLGELVYGPVKRGKSGLNEWQVRNIEKLLQMRNALTIYCWTDELTTRENFLKDKEEYAQLEDIIPLTTFFNKAQDESILMWWQFNYLLDDEYHNIDDMVERWYKKNQPNFELMAKLVDSRAVGSFYSKTLILGEISNIELEQAKYKDVNVPFANGPSAEILYKVLPKDVAISNIRKAHEEGKVKYLDEELQMPYLQNIILLGNRAKELWDEYVNGRTVNFTVSKAFHPAFIARGGATEAQYQRQLISLL